MTALINVSGDDTSRCVNGRIYTQMCMRVRAWNACICVCVRANGEGVANPYHMCDGDRSRYYGRIKRRKDMEMDKWRRRRVDEQSRVTTSIGESDGGGNECHG